MARISTDFILIDESVVDNGFRALMSGARLDDFKKNPVMLFMHNRPLMGDYANTSDPLLAIGKWYDIRIEGNQLLAKPDFDDNDPFAQRIQKKVEGGYYNGASIWIDPVGVSDDTALMLPGQSGPSVTEWGVLEASIVDIPNCRNAIAIRNEAGELMQLGIDSDNNKEKAITYLKTFLNKKNEMDNKLLNTKLGLNADASEQDTLSGIDTLLSLRDSQNKIAGENEELKKKVGELEKSINDEKINKLVTDAVRDKKILQGDLEKFKKLAVADYDTTKEFIDGLKPAQSVKEQFANHAQTNPDDELTKLTWDEIDKKNKLSALKENAELYKIKFKEKFGKDPE